MLARHAESLFWAGRYLERAEDTARLLDVTYHGLLELPSALGDLAWRDVLSVLHLGGDFSDRHPEVTAARVTEFLVVDRRNPGSIVSSIERARDNVRGVRELVSTELWEATNTLWLEFRGRDIEADLERQQYELYGMIRRRCQAIAGAAAETMPHDDGWRFLTLGRMLERAEMTCRLLNVRYAQLTATDDTDAHQWRLVLRSASALEAHRRAYRTNVDSSSVVEFLLLSREFPRSVLFCLRAAEGFLAELAPPVPAILAQRLLGRIRAALEFRDVHELLAEDLTRFLDEVQEGVGAVADAVARQFFNLVDLELHTFETGVLR
jgi:uncharacterized alpha-E superfamily protein